MSARKEIHPHFGALALLGAGFAGLAAGVLIGILIGRGQFHLGKHTYQLRAYVSRPMGLHEGGQVKMAGSSVGTITRIGVAPYPELKPVEISIAVDTKYRDFLRADSVAEVNTAGLLGDTYLEVSRGTPNQPLLPAGGVLTVNEHSFTLNGLRGWLLPGR